MMSTVNPKRSLLIAGCELGLIVRSQRNGSNSQDRQVDDVECSDNVGDDSN
jgi:hypothetical protein